MIDAESAYEGKYAAAQQYMGALRATVGPAYPIGFTCFPYVDYHPRLPYSVFLGPGGANANLPQVYWQDIGGTVDAVSGRTLAQNRIYGVADRAARPDLRATSRRRTSRSFRALWAAYGSAGRVVVVLAGDGRAPAGRRSPRRSPPRSCRPPDPGWPALARGNKGDQVVWLQQHLASADPTVAVTSTFDAATDVALRSFQQAARACRSPAPPTRTWQAVLSLPLQPHRLDGRTLAAAVRPSRPSGAADVRDANGDEPLGTRIG